MPGFGELLLILMALSGAPVKADAKAPSADVVLRYAPENADMMMHLDAIALVPGLYRTLSELPESPSVKNDPTLRAAANDLLKEVEAGRGAIKAFTGVDVVTDVSSITGWVTFAAAGDPAAIVVVRGSFAALPLDRIAAVTGGTVEEVDGAKTVVLAQLGVRLALSKSGDLLAGTDALVKARLAADWKPVKRAKGSAAARIAKTIDEKPFWFAASTPSETSIKMANAHLGANHPAVDLYASHALATLALHANGIGWTWTGKDDASYARATLLSEGAIDLMRAGVVAPRGLVRIAAAALEGHTDTSPALAYFVKNKDAVLDLVDDLTGDGDFAVKWSKEASKQTVSVRATGDRFSEVVPVAALGAFTGVGVMAAFERKGKVGHSFKPGDSFKPDGGMIVKPAKPVGPAKPAKPATKPARPATPAKPALPAEPVAKPAHAA